MNINETALSCLSRAAHAAKGEDMRGESQLLDIRRRYHCAAFNALVAVISCTKTDLKFYQAFLFAENPTKVISVLYFHFFYFSLCTPFKASHTRYEIEIHVNFLV